MNSRIVTVKLPFLPFCTFKISMIAIAGSEYMGSKGERRGNGLPRAGQKRALVCGF
jgi:hypothetical protein